MIIDSLTNIGKYVVLNPLFQYVADYFHNNDLASKPEGKEVIKGDDLFANFVVTKGKKKEEAKLETHDKMIDIQVPISGAEIMGYTPRVDLPVNPYNQEKDITFYEGLAQQYVTIYPGMFVIFFPEDGHAPAIADTDQLKKVIFKIKDIK
ncbi:MAG: YhcH/YjgK/YiaL family protein [Bacteroidaceae bacterium]|nr:YhcH/YjgK/YiaL family protein [Bacteroidaceae bacterium]